MRRADMDSRDRVRDNVIENSERARTRKHEHEFQGGVLSETKHMNLFQQPRKEER